MLDRCSNAVAIPQLTPMYRSDYKYIRHKTKKWKCDLNYFKQLHRAQVDTCNEQICGFGPNRGYIPGLWELYDAYCK